MKKLSVFIMLLLTISSTTACGATNNGLVTKEDTASIIKIEDAKDSINQEIKAKETQETEEASEPKEEIIISEDPENNESEFINDSTPIIFENFAMCYNLLGAEEYDYLQRCTEKFTETIGIRQQVNTVTLTEGSLAINGTERSFEIVFDNGETYLVVCSPSIYPRDYSINFDFYNGDTKIFSSDDSF